jgi:hypothetical protein
MDSKILENRLLLRESTIGSISVSRCASRLQTLHLKRSASSSPHAHLEAYQRDLQLYEVEMNKVARIVRVCDEELEEYASIEVDIHHRVDETEQRIRDLEQQLLQEKIIRKHKELIEACAMDVNQVASKQYFGREIRAVEDGIEGGQQSLQLAAQKIQTRSLQYDELMKSIAILSSALVDEDTKEMAVDQSFDAEAGLGDEDDDRRYEREDRRRGHSDDNAIASNTAHADTSQAYEEEADAEASVEEREGFALDEDDQAEEAVTAPDDADGAAGIEDDEIAIQGSDMEEDDALAQGSVANEPAADEAMIESVDR